MGRISAAGYRLALLLSVPFLVMAWPSGESCAFGPLGTECSECHKGTNSGSKFHTGAKGECSECHIAKGPKLLDADASSTCLRCHEAPPGTRRPMGHYIATSSSDLRGGGLPLQLTPGGDFGWLKKNYTWRSSNGETGSSPGSSHGHNIVAQSYDYAADNTLTVSPNGRYPSNSLSCVSCHDPHAKIPKGTNSAGPYRLLAGRGYRTASAPGFMFTADPPVARAPRDYNRAENATETRVAYGIGMSEWCANCHTSGCSGRTHPAGKCANCGRETVSNYNAYVKSGDINGKGDTSYLSLVPFEEGTDNGSILGLHAQNNGSYLRGPDNASNVMCLTCHRAHASGWSSMARWNMQTDFIVYKGKYPGTDNGTPGEYAQGRTAAETKWALYDRPVNKFAAAQRGLCNKCHTKD